MPMLEVFHSAETDATTDEKAALAEDAVEILREVIGTPPGRLRILFRSLAPTDTIEGLLDGDSET